MGLSENIDLTRNDSVPIKSGINKNQMYSYIDTSIRVHSDFNFLYGTKCIPIAIVSLSGITSDHRNC